MQNIDCLEDKENDKAKILIVDDQEPFLKLFKRFFRNTDYCIKDTSSPYEALKLVQSGINFDLLVTDVMMPGMTGYELCAEVRKMYNHFELPIIFLTARKEHDYIVEGFKAGANDYVTKPFEAAELIARTQTLIKLKKLYEANNLLNKELEERNRFLRLNIHDLKSPLTSIMVLAGMVQQDVMEDDDNTKNLDTIINSSEQMLSIVNDILEFNNLEDKNVNLQFDTMNFEDILSQVVNLQKPLAEQKHQNIVVKKDIDGDAKVYVDSEKIVRAVNNILGNAVKYSPKEKSIFTHICKNNCTEGSFLRLEIFDQGPGFQADEIDNVFKTFGRYSAKPTGGESSSGLGLLIAKQLIELNNGKIWIDNEYKNGSKFVIELPEA